MTSKPPFPWLYKNTPDVVTIADGTTEVIQWANYLQELLTGVSADKIPLSALSGFSGTSDNLLTNPGFEVWQRGTSFSAFNVFTADRWIDNTLVGGTIAVSQVTGAFANADSQFALQAVTSGGAQVAITQNVEAFADMRGRQVTFAADVNSSVSYYLQIYDGVNTTVSATFGASGYVTRSVTATIAGNAGQLRVGVFQVGTGTTLIDNCTLAPGALAMPYTPLQPETEYLRCYRYYQTISNSQRFRAVTGTTLTDEFVVNFPAMMAGAPVVTITAGSRTNVASMVATIATNAYIRFTMAATAGAATPGTDTFAVDESIQLEYNP